MKIKKMIRKKKKLKIEKSMNTAVKKKKSYSIIIYRHHMIQLQKVKFKRFKILN